tara:strand:+ start:118215 stop:120077 length:1863 start_codon:yes stop_codon:yes gene_type:complete
MEEIWTKAIEGLDAFASPTKRTYILYLLSALFLAAMAYLFSRNRQMFNDADQDPAQPTPKSIKSFFKYVFPKDVYLHKSSQQDYFYFIVNGFIHYGIIAAYIVAAPLFVLTSAALLGAIFGPYEGERLAASLPQLAILTIAFAILYDFGAFIVHYAMHHIPLLWAFHKVHHSAERLNPMTLYRMHPVDLVLTGAAISALTGLGVGALVYFMRIDIGFIELFGINALFFVYFIFGYNLRHSHIWLNYPKWLSHIFISPAQHQIHHSIERKHWDKNMGLIFAFWDKAFKTLYIPKHDEAKFDYGVRKSEPNPYDSVASMYIKPFVEAWEIIAKGMSKTQAAFNLVLIIAVLGFGYGIILKYSNTVTAMQSLPSTVHLQDLTWSEAATAIHKGYDRIIIPTGGVEQNGRHMILGKHNYVVTHSSALIAERLGHTLVAPVIAYVPEEVHMSYPGTISISAETFAGILEDSARSLKRHGFKYIFFIGDSSHNQRPQEDVAERLNKEWQGEGVTVASISDYYYRNGQVNWLENEGYAMREIGGHAGIRDTSELMVAHKQGIHKYPVTPKGFEGGDYNGEYKKASKKYGKQMIELKVQAALKQIHAILPAPITTDISAQSSANFYTE